MLALILIASGLLLIVAYITAVHFVRAWTDSREGRKAGTRKPDTLLGVVAPPKDEPHA